MEKQANWGRFIKLFIIAAIGVGLRYGSQPTELQVVLRKSMQIQSYERQQRQRKMQSIRSTLFSPLFISQNSIITLSQ